MTNEALRMQMLAGVITESEYKTKLQENKKKKSLKESMIGGIVGIGAINQIPPREKTDYEMAYEHYLNSNSINENESYQNDNGTKFKKINQNEFDNLNEFGVIGKFTDANGEEFIVNVMYDKADDFDSDEEAKETFNDLFSNPDNFDELLWRSAKEDLGYDTNELKLIDIIPATFL